MRLTLMLAAVTLSGLSCVAGVQLPREQLTEPGALLFNGYTRPEVDCFACHNGDGKGAKAPGLSRRVAAMSDEKLRKLVKDGNRSMPGFGDKVSEEDLTQLVEWMRKAFPGG